MDERAAHDRTVSSRKSARAFTELVMRKVMGHPCYPHHTSEIEQKNLIKTEICKWRLKRLR